MPINIVSYLIIKFSKKITLKIFKKKLCSLRIDLVTQRN